MTAIKLCSTKCCIFPNLFCTKQYWTKTTFILVFWKISKKFVKRKLLPKRSRIIFWYLVIFRAITRYTFRTCTALRYRVCARTLLWICACAKNCFTYLRENICLRYDYSIEFSSAGTETRVRYNVCVLQFSRTTSGNAIFATPRLVQFCNIQGHGL